MARQKTQATYNTFVKGLITEASDINFPPMASFDEDNCVLFRKGNRRRRLGIDYVSGLSLSSDTFSIPTYNSTEFSYYRWRSVGGNGDLDFLVFQLGTKLYFYNASTLASINSIDLTSYGIVGAASMGADKVKMIATRGKLFVVGKQLTPFYVTYTSPSTLTVAQITLNTRDFAGLDDGVAVDAHPTTLTAAHEYNLKNQGWAPTSNGTNLITTYYTAKTKYPSNTQIWFLGKDASDNLDSTLLEKQDFGNTPAPKGHYIINPFSIDRSGVSGVAGLTTVSISKRPQAVESYSGRVWYSGVDEDGFNGTVYFSQVLKNDLSNVGKCYQEADPTAEEDSTLVDNDGGEISIAEIGRIKALRSAGDTLCVFATNGVWGIAGSGTDSGFKATEFVVYKITNVGIESPDSIVEVEGQLIYWSDKGIYALTRDNISSRFGAQSLTDKTIQSLFDEITPDVRRNVQSIYDEKRRQILFLYSSTDGDTSYKRNKVLIFDITLGAFSKFTLSNLASNSPFIVGAIHYLNETDWYSSAIGYLTVVPNGSNYNFIFSEFNNLDFIDWYSKDSVGVDFDSFLEAGFEFAGDIMRHKQTIYLNAYFEQTETAWEEIDSAYQLVGASSCKMRAKWDWADTDSSNKWSTERELYRLKRHLLPDPNDLTLTYGQNVIVTKNKVRGKGRAVKFKFRSTAGKDFNLLGWAVVYSSEANV